MSSNDETDIMSPSHRTIVETFSRALTSFQSSSASLRVLATLPYSSASPSNNASSQPQYSENGLRRLIVMDSSFNPPTRAHAEMVRSALRRYGGESADDGLTGVMLLLAVNNADKAPSPPGFPVRLGMMDGFARELLRKEQDDDLEISIAITTKPYFHDKSIAIREHGSNFEKVTNAPTTEHIFLAGFDTLIRIFNPKYYAPTGLRASLSPFFEHARLRITLRPDDEWGTIEEQRRWVDELRREDTGRMEEIGGDREWFERIELVDGVEGDVVSSSKVRREVKAGREVDGMVGEEVMGWIEEEGLYRD